METPTANLQRNHQKKIRSTTSRTKRGRILKKKKKQTQVNFTIVVFINFHYNLFLIFVITTVFNIILQWKLRWILFLTSTKKRTSRTSLTRNQKELKVRIENLRIFICNQKMCNLKFHSIGLAAELFQVSLRTFREDYVKGKIKKGFIQCNF